LINWILNGQDGWSTARIQQIKETEERLDVKVQNAPQVRTVYLTSWVDGAGHVNFRPDVYDLDDTGFIVGQPLAPGELSDDGQRFVLKAQVYKVDEAPDQPDYFSFFGSRRKTKASNDDQFNFFGTRRNQERGGSNSFFFGSSGSKPKKTVSDDDGGIGAIFNFNRPGTGKVKKKPDDKTKKKEAATAGKKKPVVANAKKKPQQSAAADKKAGPAGTGEPIKKKKKVEEASVSAAPAASATTAPAASKTAAPAGPRFGQEAP